jgi:YbbR domain-containing protein
MTLKVLRWFRSNLTSLLTAIALALVVWFSAVINADPNVSQVLDQPIPIEFIGQDSALKLMGEYPTEVNLTVEAPRSIWESLNSNSASIRAWVDLSAIGPGEHTLPVQVQIGLNLARKIRQDPEQVNLTLETVLSQVMPVQLLTSGEAPLGYEVKPPVLDPQQVTVSGPSSLINRVREVRAQLDLSGVTQTITRTITLAAVDSAGRSISGVSLVPSSARVVQQVTLLGGYRNVIVKLVTTGIVANGYRLSNYFVSPASVVVFSSDPRLVESLPGYIETSSLDLTNATDDFETLLDLNLPTGVTAVNDSKVLVQVSIAAIESSLTVSLPVEITGLSPALSAEVAPATVDLIVTGPVPVLRDLKPSNIRITIDLTGFQVGVYQVIPELAFLPPSLQKVSILPTTVEVSIILAPTQTPTPRGFIATTPAVTETPTATLTPEP